MNIQKWNTIHVLKTEARITQQKLLLHTHEVRAFQEAKWISNC